MRGDGPRWLAQAQKDLADAEYLVQGERWALSCFVSQQAAAFATGVLADPPGPPA